MSASLPDQAVSASISRLEVREIGKDFGATRALVDVSLRIEGGRVTALLGENGAGKSTLIKVLAGVLQPDRGQVLLDGRPVRFADPAAAIRAGIVLVPQELRVVPALSVAENMLLGHLPVRRVGGILPVVDRTVLRRRARAVLDDMGVALDVDAPAGRLTFAERQLAIIGRALGHRARVLILDEPTASLERREVERLFLVVRRLREQGVAVIYISHRLEEVQVVADACVVMRDGRIVARMAAPPFEPEAIVQAMTGQAIEVRRQSSRTPGAPRLEVAEPHVALACRTGEIVGLGGLLGNGATALLLRIFRGPARRGDRDSSQVQASIAAGVGFVPGERARALVMSLSVRDNILLPHLHVLHALFGRDDDAIDAAVRSLMKSLDIRPLDPDVPVKRLSGGNQQKVALAKWLIGRLGLLLLDEPTNGIDIAAKATIHARIEDFAAGGGSVLISSSDVKELLELSDTVVALRRGQTIGRMQRGDGFSESILRTMLEDAQ